MPPRDPRDPRDRDELELWAIRSPVDPDDGPEPGGSDDLAGGPATDEAATPGEADDLVSGVEPEEVADLARLGAIVRSLSDDDLTVDEPPAHVWEAIVARTGIAAAGRPAGPEPGGVVVTEALGPVEPPAPAGAGDTGVTVLEPPDRAGEPPEPPLARRPRRSRGGHPVRRRLAAAPGPPPSVPRSLGARGRGRRGPGGRPGRDRGHPRWRATTTRRWWPARSSNRSPTSRRAAPRRSRRRSSRRQTAARSS